MDLWELKKQKKLEVIKNEEKTLQKKQAAAQKKPPPKITDPWVDKQEKNKQVQIVGPLSEVEGQTSNKNTLLDQFKADEDSLHGLPMNERIEKKKHLVEKYRSHCLAIAKKGANTEDQILKHWIIWLWDIKSFQDFLDYADIAIEMELKSPFKRSFEEFKLWEILNWAEEAYSENRSPEPWFSLVFDEVDDWETIHHQLAKRYLTLKFKLLVDKGDLKEAMRVGTIGLQHKAKIKTAFQEIERDLKSAESPTDGSA